MWKNISAVQATVMTEGEGLGAIFLMPVACHFEMFGGHLMAKIFFGITFLGSLETRLK